MSNDSPLISNVKYTIQSCIFITKYGELPMPKGTNVAAESKYDEMTLAGRAILKLRNSKH